MVTIGEYKEIYNDQTMPSIRDFVSAEEWNGKNDLLKFLANGKVIATAAGRAVDVFTGDIIPGELVFMTSGDYGWRSDLIYYVSKYNLKPSGGLVNKILAN